MMGTIGTTLQCSALADRRLHAALRPSFNTVRPVELNDTNKRSTTRTAVISAAQSVSRSGVDLQVAHLDREAGSITFQVAAKAALDLEQRGWAVVDNLVSQEACAAYVDSVWRWLESLGTGILRSASLVRSSPAFCRL